MVYMFLKIFAIAFDIASAAYPQHSKQKLEMSNTQLAVLTVPHIYFRLLVRYLSCCFKDPRTYLDPLVNSHLICPSNY